MPDRYKALPTLGFTHFQAAQLVTVGKRATLWMNELLLDLEEVEYRIDTLKLLGCKGTTGTQASFLELFDGDQEKVLELDRKIAAEMGFDPVPCPGQTYSRKVDSAILATLSGIAQSASKFATDLRLLCHLKEVEEPFEKNQIGSSAMPYKRNPMRCERICALARYVIGRRLEPRHDRRHPVVRAHPGRLGQQAHLRARGLPGGGRHPRAHPGAQPAGGGQREGPGPVQQPDRPHCRRPGLPMLSREELTAHLEPSRYIGRCPSRWRSFWPKRWSRCWPAIPHALEGQTAELKGITKVSGNTRR